MGVTPKKKKIGGPANPTQSNPKTPTTLPNIVKVDAEEKFCDEKKGTDGPISEPSKPNSFMKRATLFKAATKLKNLKKKTTTIETS